MNPVLQTMLEFVVSYSYFAVFFLTFLGAVALPLPTGSMMIAVSFFSTLGIFNWSWMFVIAILGNILGDHVGYWLSYKYGLKLTKYPGFRKFHETKINTVAKQLHNNPASIIIFSRFMTAVAPSVNIVAGISKMNYFSYSVFEVVGEVLEVGVTMFIGYWFGKEWEKASRYFFVLLLFTIVGFYISYRSWKYLTNKDTQKISS